MCNTRAIQKHRYNPYALGSDDMVNQTKYDNDNDNIQNG